MDILSNRNVFVIDEPLGTRLSLCQEVMTQHGSWSPEGQACESASLTSREEGGAGDEVQSHGQWFDQSHLGNEIPI